MPAISTYTLWRVLREAGYSHQRTRSWCLTGNALRRQKAGAAVVVVTDDTPKKNLIEAAYRLSEALGLSVWCTDQAGPFQTVPYPGQSWRPEGDPMRQPHEYLRDGTAKVLTLFHPADGRVRIEGATACPNTILHAWLKRELTAILAAMPCLATPVVNGPGVTRPEWERWQEDLSIKPSLLAELPPLRMLLILDNLGDPVGTIIISPTQYRMLSRLVGRVFAESRTIMQSVRRIRPGLRRSLPSPQPGMVACRDVFLPPPPP